ncbi:glucuronate isomerase [Microbacterium sp. NPDC057650]|uniref:glucuronate isomerase n=1 Tax=unclassified Microbacterium TaxID=2609290 RepID=UPI003672D8C2
MSSRLLPVDPATREIAGELHALVEHAPIISPHGHVDPLSLADDVPFQDPTELLITKDHYLTRMLHAFGVDLADLGVGAATADPRAAWRVVAERWHVFDGTATGAWIDEELRSLFGVEEVLSAASADRIYDTISARLRDADFRPRALFRSFGIEVLATTDDPLDDLAAHRRLQADGFRVLPTFRPDAYLDPSGQDFVTRVERLLAAGSEEATFDGYLHALEARREHFVASGAVSADHGMLEPAALALDPADAAVLFDRVLTGRATDDEHRRFRAHMLWQMARMSVDDGLVMTLHPGIHRNHSSATLRRHGPDTGHDIPVSTAFVSGLHPLLESFGLEKDFHLVLFTVDETTFSREIAPLAGFYPSVFIGAPWWFLDAPDAMARFRSAVTETAGFYRGSGFVDDTRAFLSIPARHDTARRVDAGFLARLVREGRVRRDAAERIMVDLVDAIPRRAFKL